MSPSRPSSPDGLGSPSSAVNSSPGYSPPPPHSRRRTREDRSSFVSVKEDDCGIAQSFIHSKLSTVYPSIGDRPATQDVRDDDMTTATSVALAPQLPGFCCPCGRFKGWKQIKLGGRGRSKSYGDIRLLGVASDKDWQWHKSPERSPVETPKKDAPKTYPPGQSAFERLPLEILDQIIPLLGSDVPPNGYAHRNVDLMACLLTSRTLHAATLMTLYKQITIPHSLIFSKFLAHIAQYPALGTVVQRLDFSHFSSVGLGRTRRMNSEIQLLTSNTLGRCLELTPRLREFLVQEHLDEDLDERVLRKLFCGLPLLVAVDFCACSSAAFSAAFSTVIGSANPELPVDMTLERLSLHECTTLPPSTFETLLPRLPRLTHLDVGHTQITDSALSAIPHSARLTHLNLSRCTRLSGERVATFITTHPAAKSSLVYLNLLSDISRYRLLSRPHVDALLPGLPPTLRALNLSGAKLGSDHVPLLRGLSKHLEELSVGHSELTMNDIHSFYLPSPPTGDKGGLSPEEEGWVPPTLHYLDLTGIAGITPSVLFSSSCLLLQPYTRPLEVLELGQKVIAGLRERSAMSKRAGWVVRELGRRGWYVREPPKDLPTAERDSGRRAWKMGASWWGLRKVPVAWGEVGGLYGHYMFKM